MWLTHKTISHTQVENLMYLFALCWAVSLYATNPIEVQISDLFIAGETEVAGVEDAPSQYAQFRIPNVVVTSSGRIVVICQARNLSPWSDRSGQDLVIRTSCDNGVTWSKARLLVDYGDFSVAPHCSVYDRRRNLIINLHNVHQWPFTEPALRHTLNGPKARQFLIFSDDDGLTWSEPREISDLVSTCDETVVFGAGHGIQLQHQPYRGRLVVPGGDVCGGKKVRAFLSDDGGASWQPGAIVPNPLGWHLQIETSITELPDGTLLLNNRSNEDGHRRRAFSSDGGQSWSTIESDPGLPDVGCNASVITVADPVVSKRSLVLYVGPVGPNRTNGTILISRDDGKTWPIRRLLINGEFGYSSLISLPDGSIGLVYECGLDRKGQNTHLRFARFDLKDLFEKKDY